MPWLRLILSTVLALVFSLSALSDRHSQSHGDAVGPAFPAYLDGSMMPYDFSAETPLPTWPEGYVPCHISYVARHGARFLSSPKKVASMEKFLYEAAKQRNLSAEGNAFFTLLRSINDSTAGRWGLLSPVGTREEEKLGERLGRQFPELMNKGEVRSISTAVPRVIMTMFQFNHSLERHHQELQLFTASGHQYDSLLRCFEFYTPYSEYRDSGDWKPIYDKWISDHISTAPARRLLKNCPDNNSLRLKRLVMDMYGILQSCRAAGLVPAASSFFSREEFAQCYRASNLLHYLRNTPNPVNGSAAAATAPLIRRIIADADSALSLPSSEYSFSGYFGHAETLLPLLSTLGIPGCFAWTEDFKTLDKDWQVNNITPLGANFEIIFLRDSTAREEKEILVTLRLNGHSVSAFPEAPMFIPWDELKAHWTARYRSFQD